ncbi:16S rRNA (uracil(1498)-N(3))-methyltransferase [Litoribacillus peritrichatus]|uniref:Ribosomal RNA small subunit methyltransferase E n=1 Tax=Litoribacillus peritrichatus TaxID=718191 RepID=A0ABP7MR77_9GAMM
MRIPRIYNKALSHEKNNLMLDAELSHYLGRVLRMKAGQQLYMFDGQGYEVLAEIEEFETKSCVRVAVVDVVENDKESPIYIHLGQSISKGDRMEFTIQKSVELGISEITPIFAERSEVKLKGERLQKKVDHWQSIAASACEQCGRSVVPKVNPPVSLEQWLRLRQEPVRITLHHRATADLRTLEKPLTAALLIGPEGGLSETEIKISEESGFKSITIGPRVLRTETASLTVLSLMQYQWGDL